MASFIRFLSQLLLGFFFISNTVLAAEDSASPGKWLELKIGPISSASAEILKSALQVISDKNLDGLLIVLDTPGGSLEATRTMVQDIMASTVPVVVWVGPDGAHAGSAGSFITLAAHIAAMAPGTQIGAAHPVDFNGQNIDEQSDLRTKIENDAAAFMESIATTRGRNIAMARSLVSNSLSVTAQEALDNKLIDLVAPQIDQLFASLNGRDITLTSGKYTLKTPTVERVLFAKSIRHQILEILSNPNLFYLLFVIGLLCLSFEFTHPGVIVPGVVGAICLILALIATSVLPVNFGAALLVMASVAFMIAEIFVPSFGALGIGGIIGFVTGSLLLIDDTSHPGISLWMIIPAAVLTLSFFLFLSWLILRNLRSRAKTGVTTLVGMEVEAVEYFVDGHGHVRVFGELWNGIERDHKSVKPGDRLQVHSVEGLNLQLYLLPEHKGE